MSLHLSRWIDARPFRLEKPTSERFQDALYVGVGVLLTMFWSC